MSDGSMPKWLMNWISPINLTKPDNTGVETSNPGTVLHKLASKPLDIKGNSVKGRIKSCCRLNSAVAVKNFLPLQRLDSTGNHDTDIQPRFSYPPYKTINCGMGNNLQAQVREQINPPKQGLLNQSACSAQLLQENSPDKIFLRKVFDTFSGTITKAAQRFASLPSNLDKSEDFVDNMSGHSRNYLLCRDASSSLAPVSAALCGLNSNYHQQTNHDTQEALLVSDVETVFNLHPQKCQQPCKQVSDINASEIHVMSEECFNEVQSLNRFTLNSQNTYEDHKTTKEQSVCESTEDFSEVDWSDYDSDSSVYYSESDLDSTSDFEPEEVCNPGSHNPPLSDTDSDDLCPWDKITLRRNSWTCSKTKKLDNNSSLTTIDSKNGDNKPQHPKSKTDAELLSQDIASDSGYNEADIACDLFVPITVERPVCSNAYIASILGCADVESDSEDEISENDQNWNRSPQSPKAKTVTTSLAANQFESSCKIWEYFERIHQPLTRFVCGNNDPVKEDQSMANKLDIKLERETPELSPKKPTKVRFSDKVVVHPIIAWSFAYKQARKGEWECYARDRDRFHTRTTDTRKKIAWCFSDSHRKKVWESRFQHLDGPH